MTRRFGAFVRKDKLGAKISNYEWGVLLPGIRLENSIIAYLLKLLR